jgi:hypothetical protein
MAWETRSNGRRYYYRVRRVNGRVVREYCGGGERGMAAAEADRARALEKKAKRDFDDIDADYAALIRITDLLFRAYHEAAGYHLHRGEWRKRRVRRTGAVQPPVEGDSCVPPNHQRHTASSPTA